MSFLLIDNKNHTDNSDIIELKYMKFIYLGSISLVTLIGTFLLPFLSKKYTDSLHYINGFSGAIMFSTAFIHLLPHILENQFTTYPFAMLFVVLSFYIIMFIEKIIFHIHHHETSTNCKGDFIKNIINVLAIGLHAMVAGITIGISDTHERLTQIFIAVISHKLFASYAIGNKIFKSNNKCAIIIPLLVFNMMTPGGVIIGYYVNNINPWLDMILNSISIGAFLYIGCTDTLIDEIEMHHDHTSQNHEQNRYTETSFNTSNITSLRSLEIDMPDIHRNSQHHKPLNKLKLYVIQLFGVLIIAVINIYSIHHR